jgi:hypothetical protein
MITSPYFPWPTGYRLLRFSNLGLNVMEPAPLYQHSRSPNTLRSDLYHGYMRTILKADCG